MSNLALIYKKEVVKKLVDEFKLASAMACPKIEKIVINCGLGEATTNPKLIEEASQVISAISGQKPAETRAKRSISAFKLKKGQAIGLKVTLRGKRMYSFLEKLFKIALPRLRDFRGLPVTNFDKAGNYTLGFAESNIFPEVATMPANLVKGVEVTIVINLGDLAKSKRLLELLGTPFAKH